MDLGDAGNAAKGLFLIKMQPAQTEPNLTLSSRHIFPAGQNGIN